MSGRIDQPTTLRLLKAEKQPYAIHLKSGEPLAFAGLWDA